MKTMKTALTVAVLAFAGWMLLASFIYFAPWATISAISSLTVVCLACRDEADPDADLDAE